MVILVVILVLSHVVSLDVAGWKTLSVHRLGTLGRVLSMGVEAVTLGVEAVMEAEAGLQPHVVHVVHVVRVVEVA